MTDSFRKQLETLRESIYHGSVTEGVTKLTAMLQITSIPEERVELLLDFVLLSLTCNDLDEAQERWAEAYDCANAHENIRCQGYHAFFTFLDGQKKAGLNALAKVIEDAPNNFEFHLLRAIAYIQNNKFAHAQADLVRASTLSPENILVMSILADVTMELNDLAGAMAMHEKVLTISPDFRRSLMSLGVIYFEQQRLEDAFRLFQCLIAYDPANWFAWSCLGDTCLSTPGKTLRSMPYYAAAIVTGSEIGLTYINLATSLVILGKLDQAIRVLNLYRKNTNQPWHKNEEFSVRFIQLMADVVNDPNMIKSPEFNRRLRKLYPCNDESTKFLFQLLATAASISYQDDINIIITRHLFCFVVLARYLSSCAIRPVFPEETFMYCILARYFIWHGMIFETRAILSILMHAEDPRISDIITVITNEIQRFEAAQNRTYIRLENFHREIIQTIGADPFIEQIMAGEAIQVPNRDFWMQRLDNALGNHECTDLKRIFFNAPALDNIKQFDAAVHMQNQDQKDEYISDFWFDYDIWQSMFDISDPKDFEQIWKACEPQFQSDPSIRPYLRNLAEHHRPKTQDITSPNPPQPQQLFKETLQLLINPKTRCNAQIEINAHNNNTIQFCAASPDEALGGFAPMPFALDGTAFARFMKPTRVTTEILNENNSKDYFKSWIMPYIHHQTIGTQDAEKRSEKIFKQIEKYWRALHGEIRVKDTWINTLMPDAQLQLEKILPQHAALQHFKSLAEMDEIPPTGYQLPKSPRIAYPLHVSKEKYPAFIKDAHHLERCVSYNFITFNNLVEFFFNHAIYNIEQWLDTQDTSHLQIFFEGTTIPFVVFDTLEKMNLDLANITPTLPSPKRLKTIRESVLNNKKACKTSLCHTPDDLAESLKAYEHWAKTPKTLLVDAGMFLRSKLHIFGDQFSIWANLQAEKLYPEICRLEAELHQVTPTTLYLVTWRIRDLINRFPWMSRLYVMLASAYARVDQYDEALKALENGLPYEFQLYKDVGWQPIAANDAEHEQKLNAVETLNELEESQMMLWNERYVFQPRDEAMYHYASYLDGYQIRKRRGTLFNIVFQRECFQDKGGAFEFYQLFKRFIPRVPQLRDAFCSALATHDRYDLRDYMVHVITHMLAPETFPLRRQIAELLFTLYPDENTGALGRFYCDNMQPANALPMAAYAYFAETTETEDDETQSSVTLGCLLYDMGYMEAAIEYLDRAVNIKNPSPMAFLTRGCAYIEVREFHKAIECLKAGLVIDPSFDRFHYNLALAYLELNMLDEAEQSIKAGIQLSKYPVDLNMQLMRVYIRRQKFSEAMALARYVANEDPDMFCMAIKFEEFNEFKQLKPVQDLLKEFNFDPNAF